MHKDYLKKISTSLFVIGSLLLISMVAVYFYRELGSKEEVLSSFESFVNEAMLIYLIVVLTRTAVHLLFSFLEYMFYEEPDLPKDFPLVTIIIPCFNEGIVIEKAVKSVQEIEYPNLEILVVDDGSTDDTFEIAKKMEKDYSVRVLTKVNGGKSKALNYGIEQSLGEFFVCMDADSILGKNLLLKTIPLFEKDAKLAAVAGSVVVGNSGNLITAFQKLEYIIGLNFVKRAQSFLNCVTIVPGPIGVFKKDVVLKLGGYESDTFAEDCDLSMRLLMNGYHIKYVPDITATTEAPDEFLSLITQRYRWSRGITQAIHKSFAMTFKNFTFRSFALSLYMYMESIFIPTVNFIFIMTTLFHGLQDENTIILGQYFIGLTVLDIALSLYSIIMEKELAFFFGLAAINRLTYGLILEVIRFFSVVDQLFNLPMKWGVLQRKGM